MNILIVGLDAQIPVIEKLSAVMEDLSVLDGLETDCQPGGSSEVDALIGSVSEKAGPGNLDLLVSWRTHPHTYLVPCWIAGPAPTRETGCLWPKLTIDRFEETVDLPGLQHWLEEISHWQQNRMLLAPFNTFDKCSPLEIASSLALRKATGRLLTFDDENHEGTLFLREGRVTGAGVKHLRGEEAFHEFLSWSEGSYSWDPERIGEDNMEPRLLEELIREGLALFREANLFYPLVRDWGRCLRPTGSQSALDDAAVPIYPAQRELYKLIDGRTTAGGIIEASPLSRPRTLSCLAKWLSMGDIEEEPRDAHPSICRVLIVDDSPLMCGALQSIFSRDSRLEIVGCAHDGLEALDLIDRQKPDVVTLDLQMPRMDGLTTLKHIMIRNPTPVVVLSAFTQETSRWTYESFKYGAVDVMPKPGRPETGETTTEMGLSDRVSQASRVRLQAARYIRKNKCVGADSEDAATASTKSFAESPLRECRILIVCGTGGFPSLLKILLSVSRVKGLAPMIGCVGMPPRVVSALLPNLEQDMGTKIEILGDPSSCRPGTVYLCSVEDPAGQWGHASPELRPGGTEGGGNEGRPLDRLLGSLARKFGPRLLTILISGTGEDGIRGMESVKQAEGETYVLSPEACLRPDLPRKILDLGLAREVASTDRAVEVLRKWNDRMMAAAAVDGGLERIARVDPTT